MNQVRKERKAKIMAEFGQHYTISVEIAEKPNLIMRERRITIFPGRK